VVNIYPCNVKNKLARITTKIMNIFWKLGSICIYKPEATCHADQTLGILVSVSTSGQATPLGCRAAVN
jgi:hypothetical protein